MPSMLQTNKTISASFPLAVSSLELWLRSCYIFGRAKSPVLALNKPHGPHVPLRRHPATKTHLRLSLTASHTETFMPQNRTPPTWSIKHEAVRPQAPHPHHSPMPASSDRHIILDPASLTRPNRGNRFHCLQSLYSHRNVCRLRPSARPAPPSGHGPDLWRTDAILQRRVRNLGIRLAKAYRHLQTSPINHDGKLGACYGNRTGTIHALFPRELCST